MHGRGRDDRCDQFDGWRHRQYEFRRFRELHDGGVLRGGQLDQRLTAPTGQSCPDGWWDCEWSYRRRVSVTANASGTHSDVPVAVRLGPGRIEYELMQADAEDLRFVSAEGSVLPYEIESWDPAGTSMVWTTLDIAGSSDDHFWIYYGNAAAQSPAQLSCGDGFARDGSEECDGDDLQGMGCVDMGFEAGMLACDAKCGFDTQGCCDTPPC